MSKSINIIEFLKESKNTSVLDVRSPSEFEQGHIPGAINIPLLNNEERAKVGLTFKEKGRSEAVVLGFELVGNKFAEKIRMVEEKIKSKNVLIYCWRGGLRSEVFSWILHKAGWNTVTLIKGYKIFRNWVLETLEQPRKLKILGGLTGSGKTEFLQKLSEKGEQVIDLEKLACHKGSAFGALGQNPQPTNEQFENELAMCWSQIDAEKPLWLEDESRNIGKIKIPDKIYSQMRSSDLYVLEVTEEERIKRILNDYGKFSKEILIDCTRKIEKKLGTQQLKESINYLNDGRMEEWAKLMLAYYDKMYKHGMSQRDKSKIHLI
ncbi:MAG: tRNA 2-selenouridine(34) synthase MnmH [Bacteroidetes bacterium RIFCSPLOWO2_02_FULL_36_8]|nr:MAG: tRNA 2-selenouridine(34) synthase MnmH [Bacteroidetes bacterium RIFCSPLOWO2_02_FULL_36_8]OFY72080.1 MAG: tRNA 2-selenouridine(34) synthase MnmH [Bacteroidetes bacterium RIFCSPLOWO2_12_FULL_37_12]